MSLNERSSRLMMTVALTMATLAAAFGLCAVAQADSHVFQCPTQIQVDGSPLSLAGLNVFEGPIENQVALAPETSPGDPGAMHWRLDAGATPYMKCRYQGSPHYLVLEAKGATRCIAKVAAAQVFEASCL